MGIYGPYQLRLGGKVRLCYLPGTHSVDGLAARPFRGPPSGGLSQTETDVVQTPQCFEEHIMRLNRNGRLKTCMLKACRLSSELTFWLTDVTSTHHWSPEP